MSQWYLCTIYVNKSLSMSWLKNTVTKNLNQYDRPTVLGYEPVDGGTGGS